jgi:hypothetical protein
MVACGDRGHATSSRVRRPMLFQQRFLDGIRDGSITVAFRRWRRPTVRSGGTLLTAVGEIAIASVSVTTIEAIGDGDARRAGYASLTELRADLMQRDEGELYRIELGRLGPDPRVALRQKAALTNEERRVLLDRLARLDARAPEPWTSSTLELIRAHPGMRAADLCRLARQEKDAFKVNVRKLKTLGLTESLEVGYRLSPRGAAILVTPARRENLEPTHRRSDQRG